MVTWTDVSSLSRTDRDGSGVDNGALDCIWSQVYHQGVPRLTTLLFRYLKCIDKFFNNYISCFVTAGNVKFLLLHQPIVPTSGASSRLSTAIGANPTSPATEEAIKMFFAEVYENWVKAIMSPFYRANMEVRSPIFRTRVAAAGRKYL
jgi:hypothetical protein